MTETVLEARDVVRHFPIGGGVLRGPAAHVRAVDGVSLELREGETLGIVGESGCGKSTMARILAGLDRPTSGEVRVLGRPISGLRGRAMRRVRRDVQMVFQDPYTSLDPRMSVGDTVREPFLVHPDLAPRGERDRRARELLEIVGLNPDHAGRYPHEFSGGQRQRIGIARALALRPRILVCDEPTSALDVSVQAQIVNLLDRLKEEFRLAYVFISHDLGLVQHVADRVSVMYLGRVIESGTQDDVYDRAAHPYTQALLSAAPRPDPGLRGEREEIVLEGEPPSPAAPPSGCHFHTRCWKADARCAVEPPEFRRHEGARPGGTHLVSCHRA
ncbi:oligopeptide/dipeptide ABC transporter ATP-binding protein [Microtetraspora sp. NBRC 16547]|uniref:ABC transporter ATP-binding protein n=1 Tax=Microtetraspora sp. NBRC 16547 TaxID=3030993 RepID=UPI0024A21F37|nr:oligopeptide/dipeptide ABC transporter ATP-binding protein [Microtetraspora sp. NBRC 16547]GLW99430.1 ABC transporter ATP-binding protein [Microtetraspora sp. NBRC 16547]